MIDDIVLYVNLFFPRCMDKNYDGFVNKSLNFRFRNYNEFFIKSCLVYQYLYDKYFNKFLDMDIIVYDLNNGLTDLLF